jgi:hypothetical protein
VELFVIVGSIVLACSVVSSGLGWLLEGRTPFVVRVTTDRAGRPRRRPQTTPDSPVLLELELRRIAARLQEEYESPQPAKAERVRGWVLAYDRVLIELCESCDLPPPRPVPPLSAAERFTVEHALVGTGRSW